MKKIGVGLIGTGFIGPVHIEGVRRLGYAEVIAVAECNDEVAKAKAAALHVERAYGDYKALLADPDIDAVHICTPNNLHYQIAKDAIAAGKHVICEKPLAMDIKEGEELVKLAKQSNVICAMHLNCRAYPLIQHVKDMVAKGDLGEIYAVNGSYQQDWLFKETDYSWRLEPEFTGHTRALADIGTHWFDAIEMITGLKVDRVCADLATFHKTRKKPLKEVETYSGKILSNDDYEDMPIDTEDYATVLLHFDNGAHGSFTTNQVAAGRKNRMYFEIYGSKCAVAYDSEVPNQLWIGQRDGNNEILIKDPSLMYESGVSYNSYPGGHAEGFADASKHTLMRIYAAIAAGKNGEEAPAYPTFEDGLRELVICETIYQSSKEEKWLSVPR